jgi:hypothetical protein
MAARVQLNNFRFSIYIDADGTVTLTDLPSELREVVEALDPAHTRGGGSLPSPFLTAVAAEEASAAAQPACGGVVERHGRG